MEAKEGSQVLDTENFDAIAAEAYAEMDNDQGLSDVPKKKDDEASQSDDQKEADSSKPSDENKDDTGAEPDKTAEEGSVEKVKEVADEVISDQMVNDYAVKHGMTPVEAKADIEATRAVLKNYKSPEEIARALRSTQSAYDKLRSTEGKKPAQQVFTPLSDEQFIKEATAHFTKEQDQHVEQYRQKFPAKSELMTDEAIIEEIVYKSLDGYKSWSKEKSNEVVQTANKRREEILSTLADDDRKWIPSVKAIIDNVNPQALLSDSFDVEDLLRHARGEKAGYLAAIKEAEERGYKRAMENPRILGMKGEGSSGPTSTGKGSKALNSKQQARAVEMFPDQSADEAYKAFREVYEDDLKKNPNFVS